MWFSLLCVCSQVGFVAEGVESGSPFKDIDLGEGVCLYDLIPLCAKFFKGSMYLHFVSFLHIDITQVVEILPQVRQELTYFT